MRKNTYIILGIVAVVFLITLSARSVLSAIPHHPKTLADLQTAASLAMSPAHKKIRILIVPGHEPNSGGTSFGNLKERDLAVSLGEDLQRDLNSDGRYQVIMTRNEQGWNPIIAQYFSQQWNAIDAWRKQALTDMNALIASGAVKKPVVHIGHNNAPHDVAVRLYGITKWANENDIDVVIHIHFDDDRASNKAPGHRTGFAIFVPPPEYFNGAPTQAIAQKVLARLHTFDPIGNLAGEASGVVTDPQLIAVGEQNTADPASMLIEYAFIYEKQLQTAPVRSMALDDMAYQTFLGVDDFFFDGTGAPPRPFPTTVLPHTWSKPIGATESSTAVYALQTALTLDGDFPPPGKTKNDCSRTGVNGPCTSTALKQFQKKYGITGEDGNVGKKTMAQLNMLFSR